MSQVTIDRLSLVPASYRHYLFIYLSEERGSEKVKNMLRIFVIASSFSPRGRIQLWRKRGTPIDGNGPTACMHMHGPHVHTDILGWVCTHCNKCQIKSINKKTREREASPNRRTTVVKDGPVVWSARAHACMHPPHARQHVRTLGGWQRR